MKELAPFLPVELRYPYQTLSLKKYTGIYLTMIPNRILLVWISEWPSKWLCIKLTNFVPRGNWANSLKETPIPRTPLYKSIDHKTQETHVLFWSRIDSTTRTRPSTWRAAPQTTPRSNRTGRARRPNASGGIGDGKNASNTGRTRKEHARIYKIRLLFSISSIITEILFTQFPDKLELP